VNPYRSLRDSAIFLGFVLLMWLPMHWLILAPDTARIEALREERRTALAPTIETSFGSGESVAAVRAQFQTANEELRQTLDKLEEIIDQPLPQPLLPVDKLGRHQAYTREVLERLQAEVRRAAESMGVRLGSAAATLGLELPEAYGESIEQDLLWLEQMHASRDLLRTLFEAIPPRGGERDLLAVEEIEPFEAETSGQEPSFVRELPLELELTITLQGLIRFLHACASAQTHYTVEDLLLDADPEARRGAALETARSLPDGGRVLTSRTLHAYRVRLRLVRVELTEEAERRPPSPPPEMEDFLPAEERDLLLQESDVDGGEDLP